MRTSFLLTSLFLMAAGVQAAQADEISTYNVGTIFDDGTSFAGTFTYDNTNLTVTSLSGTLNDSMGDTVTFNGTSGPLVQSNSSGEIKASIYLTSPTFTLLPDGSQNQASINNAYETIAFSASDPTNTASYINDIVSADCTAASTMSNCSTGIGIPGGGTMGSPQNETITFVSSTTSAVPLPTAVWPFLTGVMGMLSFSRKRNAV